MPRRRPEVAPWQPMTMTWGEVAAVVFRRPESWVRTHLPADFPRPHQALDLFAREAVEQWVRRSFGLALPTSATDDVTEATLIARARDPNAKHRRALPRRSAA